MPTPAKKAVPAKKATPVKKASAPKPSTAPASKPKPQTDWAKEYGVQAALVESVPELKTLFNQAVTEGWTAGNFTAQFQNTDWYKTHNDAWRTAYATEKTDPASWQHELDLVRTQIANLAVSTGVSLDADKAEELARQSLYLSAGSASKVDPTALKQHFVTAGIVTGLGGEGLTTIDALKAHSADMGLQYDDAWYSSAAKNILQGDGTIQGWQKKINDTAKSKYASFADQIDTGSTVRQIASPYINSMANILELPSNSINLDDPTINKALTSLDSASKPALQPLWQFETSLRKDPRWASTKNARDAVDSVARSVLSDMGLAY